MASIQTITNTPAGSGNGDTAYIAANKINSNFTNVNNAKLEKGSYTGTAADLKSDIDNLSFSGLKSYDTRAQLYAVTEPSGTPAKVVNDPTTSYNGYYSSNGSTWTKDSYQPGDGANAGTLNGLTSSQFARTDIGAETFSGTVSVSNNFYVNGQYGSRIRDTNFDATVISQNRTAEDGAIYLRPLGDTNAGSQLKLSKDNAVFESKVTANSFKTTAWEVIEESGILKFKYNGSTKFQFKSTGVIEATDHKNGLI